MLRQDLTSAMKTAMKNKDKRRLTTIRLILAAIKDRDIASRTGNGSEMDEDAMIIEILSKMIKQRKESFVVYEEAGRLELAQQEQEEIEIISEFLPRQMPDDEIEAAVKEAIAETEATGLKDIGKVMAILKGKYAGQMDFSKASAQVRAALS
ncbi:GatB/YqeY domain-containing protein [Paremcibacter congregatus]|uniref:Glutamyl-tRNA amidotransferase n=1 Tax=Paremcibacter congregatus TaxID=2043170 RepID=A0A2G4YRB1_9PROT|nr:GatB/YqeY domain-containing protein [Paremcibacter congregatus]PHZ84862.1 glutamyl-tRNA amidotransferase [Paremcibacter congregatus]QDE26164.1 GatB/YqeY domain-containing protein [Paremcibacter congregatus]|tara:strand:- start:7727 stop:8182 length:456 start_codon:yes stop_codon:yes gene_type:complete